MLPQSDIQPSTRLASIFLNCNNGLTSVTNVANECGRIEIPQFLMFHPCGGNKKNNEDIVGGIHPATTYPLFPQI
jgi:hypothetical protein